MKNKVFVITGPTASGKSGIGIELAKRINGVVISADSMQIYKDLNVGTAKVTKEEADGIEHLLIDIVDVKEKFSVSDYKEMCYAAIKKVLKENKVPIIVGGTGLYINAVVNNMQFESFEKDNIEKLEKELNEITSNKNAQELYDKLMVLDPLAAEKIDSQNTKRVIHAIKMNLMGINKSDMDKRQDLWSRNESDYDFFTVYIEMPKDLLYDRINRRVDLMVKEGILEEAKELYDIENKNVTACQAIGYKEFFKYFEGEATLEEAVELLKQKTRNYAKRQITWFKKLPDKLVVDGTKTKDEIVTNILKGYYEEYKENRA